MVCLSVCSSAIRSVLSESNAIRFIEVDHLSVFAIGRGNGEVGKATSVKPYDAESIQQLFSSSVKTVSSSVSFDDLSTSLLLEDNSIVSLQCKGF